MNILLIEDDLNLRHGLQDLFSMEEFNVTACEYGKDVKRLVEQSHPDVCIFDVMLPDTNGYKMCKIVRRFSSVPVILLSARGDEIDRIRGFEVGADDYVTKPFSSIELIHRIKVLNRRANTARQELCSDRQSESFSIGDLQVNGNELRAYRKKESIDLAAREFNILYYLFQHVNQVVRRDELYENCWGMPYFADSRALDQYISALRQKIEIDVRSPKIIKTVRGSGYRYEQT